MRAMVLKVTSIAKLKNKYIVRSRISEATLCKIFREIRILMSKECEVLKSYERSEVEQRGICQT